MISATVPDCETGEGCVALNSSIGMGARIAAGAAAAKTGIAFAEPPNTRQTGTPPHLRTRFRREQVHDEIVDGLGVLQRRVKCLGLIHKSCGHGREPGETRKPGGVCSGQLERAWERARPWKNPNRSSSGVPVAFGGWGVRRWKAQSPSNPRRCLHRACPQTKGRARQFIRAASCLRTSAKLGSRPKAL